MRAQISYPFTFQQAGNSQANLHCSRKVGSFIRWIHALALVNLTMNNARFRSANTPAELGGAFSGRLFLLLVVQKPRRSAQKCECATVDVILSIQKPRAQRGNKLL
jgi:hypothetical protein